MNPADLTITQLTTVIGWVHVNFISRKTPNKKYSSLKLRNIFMRSHVGFKITHPQFKIAMRKGGFKPVDYGTPIWFFCISGKSPALHHGGEHT